MRLVLLFSSCVLGDRSATHAQVESIKTGIQRSKFLVKRDCNTENCHGNKADGSDLWNQAGEIWFVHDPHSYAYDNLLSRRSLQIVQKFWSGPEPPPESVKQERYRVFLENNCVACHASESSPISQRVSGVDCQSCHGSELAWNSDHYSENSQDWTKFKRDAFFQQSPHHPVDTKSPWVIASLCGACHVGQLSRTGKIQFDDDSSTPIQQREVSHQLMAAGHPPTYFELGHYLRRYPKHWWDEERNFPTGKKREDQHQALKTIAGRSLEVWRVGKLVNAWQRLELLEHRLSLPEWPEFTEHRCTSCHHQINPSTHPQQLATRSFAPWDGWYLEQVDLALEITQSTHTPLGEVPFTGSVVKEWNQALTALRSLLANPLLVHQSDSIQEIRKQVAIMKRILRRGIEEKSPMIATDEIASVSEAWAMHLTKNTNDVSWESSIQIRLAADALANPAINQADDDRLPKQVLRETPWDLPAGVWHLGENPPYDASRFFDPRRFTDRLQEIQQSFK